MTSQQFTNFYLAPLDRFIKEHLRRGAYVRYRDDFVVWGQSGADLRGVWREAEAFLTAELRLALKPNVGLIRTAFGMDFLGYRVFPQELRLPRRSQLRFARSRGTGQPVQRHRRAVEMTNDDFRLSNGLHFELRNSQFALVQVGPLTADWARFFEVLPHGPQTHRARGRARSGRTSRGIDFSR